MMSKAFQQGASLVEVMVALTVSMFLMLGIFQVFVGVSASNNLGMALARVQETGRFTLDYLARDFRLIGYQGCIDTQAVGINILANNSPTNDIPNTELQGFRILANGNWTAAVPAELNAVSAGVATLSDVIYVQHAQAGVSELASDAAASGDIALDDNNLGFDQGDLLIITDCNKADLFEVTNNPGGVILQHDATANTAAAFSGAYATDSRVMRFIAKAFYVQDTGRNNSTGDDVFGLYQFDVLAGANQEQEIVEGVEHLIFEYGQELSDGNVRYVNIQDGNLDIDEVDRLRVAVLVASTERALSQDDTTIYNLFGFQVGPTGTNGVDAVYANDRRVRKAFSSTYVLRNRNR